MEALIWEWIPNTSIGFLLFEEEIDISSLPFECVEVKSASNDEPWITFEMEDKSRFSIEERVLISAEIVSSFIYKGMNLIGMSIKEVTALIGKELVLVDSWDDGKELSCDELGVIIWVENDVVDSISVSS